ADQQRALGHVVEAGVLAVAVAVADGDGALLAGGEEDGARVGGRVERLGQLDLGQAVVGEGAGDHVAVVGGERVAGAGGAALAGVAGDAGVLALVPYTTLFRSADQQRALGHVVEAGVLAVAVAV